VYFKNNLSFLNYIYQRIIRFSLILIFEETLKKKLSLFINFNKRTAKLLSFSTSASAAFDRFFAESFSFEFVTSASS